MRGKKVSDMDAKGLMKKFKDKAFAAKIDRDIIKEIEKMGLSLEEFFQIAIDSIKNIKEKVGLTQLTKMSLIIKSNIRKVVKDLDKEDMISSVADEVERALDRKVEDILAEGIKRAKANNRKTLQARDL